MQGDTVGTVIPGKGEDRCLWHDTLVEALGRNGKNGRLGNLEKLVTANREDADDTMKALDSELKTVKAVQLKLIIWTAVAAGGSSAAASVAFKLIAT